MRAHARSLTLEWHVCARVVSAMQKRDGTCDSTTKGYKCSNFMGTCEHGTLKPTLDRRKDDDCGVCDDDHRNVDGQCLECTFSECENGFDRTGVCSDESDG